MKSIQNCQRIMYNLLISMSLCDGLGDAWDNVLEAAREMECDIPKDYDPEEHTEMLVRRGYKGLWGGNFNPEDFDEEDE